MCLAAAPRISFGVEQDCGREGKRREGSAASLGSGAPMGVWERGDLSGRFLLMCFSCRDYFLVLVRSLCQLVRIALLDPSLLIRLYDQYVILIMFATTSRSHMHIHDVINLLLFFMPKFDQISSNLRTWL